MNLQCRDFEDWRVQARGLLFQKVSPDKVFWRGASGDLFSQFISDSVVAPPKSESVDFVCPKEFITLAQAVALHRDSNRWHVLYGILWALINENKKFLEDESHPLVHQARIYFKQVRRDMHKMTAFVRFEKFIAPNEEECFLAWYEPDHFIVKATAPFFKKRFGSMNWIILTPEVGAAWNQKKLEFIEGPIPKPESINDEMKTLWRTYYSHIFNPARVKVKMMKTEMPVRFWKNLPEAQDIARLLHEAPARAKAMVAAAQHLSVKLQTAPIPEEKTLPALQEALKNCKACDLCESQRPAVFSEGDHESPFVLVGEQPGDLEDKLGKPFVGPAGQLLKTLLREIGAPLEKIYFTNAVKHFRFVNDGKFRIHKSPHARHIKACRDWVGEELKIVKATRVLCLGATAAQSILGFSTPVLTARKEGAKPSPLGQFPCFVTLHPSALLRATSPSLASDYRKMLKEDLRKFFLIDDFDNRKN